MKKIAEIIEFSSYQEETVKTVDALPDESRTIAVLAVWLGETVAAADFASKGRIFWPEQERR